MCAAFLCYKKRHWRRNFYSYVALRPPGGFVLELGGTLRVVHPDFQERLAELRAKSNFVRNWRLSWSAFRRMTVMFSHWPLHSLMLLLLMSVALSRFCYWSCLCDSRIYWILHKREIQWIHCDFPLVSVYCLGLSSAWLLRLWNIIH